MKRICVLLVLLLASCKQQDHHMWLGYAEGDYVYVSAPQAGWVTRVDVRRGAQVKAGNPLFALDDTSQIAARDAAQAAIAQAGGRMKQAQASLKLARKDLFREKQLVKYSAASRQAYDQAETTEQTSVALVSQIEADQDQARASLANATYQLAQRKVVSRTAGQVQQIYFRQGEYAPAQTPVVSILPPDNIYVRFFVPEAQLSRIHLGDRVKVRCDGCAADIVASITFIASREEYTPPVIFSNESRQQLVFKVEARAPGGLKLHPGEPVDVHPL